MSGAGFILAINLCVAGLFAIAFFLVAANNKTDRVALWFGFAYLFGVGYFVFEFLLPMQTDARLAGFGGFASFLGAVTAISIGVARRYGVPVPWRVIAVAVVVSLVVNWIAVDLPRDSFFRMTAYQAPYAFMQGLGALLILGSKRRQPMDRGLTLLFILSALQFLSKPFVAQITGGPGASAQEYVQTIYALYSQTGGAILAVAIGLLMLMLLVRDMLVDVTMRSETDPLSGLFNRRGFEDRVQPGLIATSRGGVTASLVACDLDHFKAVNDTYGHDMGDEVIQSFANLLKAAAPERATVARMGGEEFAVFLPGINSMGARLYAESVRVAFASQPPPGLPAHERFTASFGVAESIGHESLSDLRRRADTALYSAKQAGRDRVGVADMALVGDRMPAHPLAIDPPTRKPAKSG